MYITASSLRRSGGQTTHILEFCEALARRAQVTLVAPADSAAVVPHVITADFLALPRVMRGIAFELALARYLARRAPRPDVIYVRAGVYQFVPLLYARALGVPCLLEVNGDLVAEFRMQHPPRSWLDRGRLAARLQLYRVATWASYRLADGVVAVTEALAALVRGYGAPAERVRILENGVNVRTMVPLRAVECRARLGLPVERRYIGYIGSLAAWQDVPTLVTAFGMIAAEHPDVDLLIVGDGAQRAAVERQRRAAGLTARVRMVGAVSRAQAHWYLGACDIATAPKRLLPSGFSPLKVYEALSCAVPIVAPDAPGLGFIANADVGRLYQPEQAADLACQLDRLLRMPAHELRAIGLRGRRRAESCHSWDAVVDQVMAFARECAIPRLSSR